MSRTPPAPIADPDARPTVVGAALLASASLVFVLLGGILALPWALGRLAHAIRAMDDRRVAPRGTARVWASGFASLGIVALPSAVALGAQEHARVWGAIEPWRIVGPIGLALTLVPLFSRLPLVLVIEGERTRPSSLLAALERSISLAIAAPRATVLACLALFGTGGVLALVGSSLARLAPGLDLYTTLGTLALAPWAFGGVMIALSRHTPDEPPPARPWMLGVLGALVAPPVMLLVVAGALATAEPRALTVVREGHGVQAVRGMRRELGPRGVYEGETYRVTGDLDALVITRADGSTTRIVARYRPDDAVIHRRACTSEQTSLRRECDELVVEGPDWQMTVRLDGAGRRLDDGALDRALERLGRLGVGTLLAALLGAVWGLVRVARLRRRARAISGRDRRHRLPARLVLGEGGALEGTWLTGEQNRVELRDGDRTLRLPTKQDVLAIQRGRERVAIGVPIEVVLACDVVPSVVVHRAAEAPLPADASLVIGDPEAIESEALGDARRSLGRLVAFAITLTALAHLALTFA